MPEGKAACSTDLEIASIISTSLLGTIAITPLVIVLLEIAFVTAIDQVTATIDSAEPARDASTARILVTLLINA